MANNNDTLADDFNHLLQEAERVMGSSKWVMKLVKSLGKKLQHVEERNIELEQQCKSLEMERDELFDKLERLKNEGNTYC